MEDKSVLANDEDLKEETAQEEQDPMIMEEYEIEELSVDGICGVY